jgi:hypothetical protein
VIDQGVFANCGTCHNLNIPGFIGLSLSAFHKMWDVPHFYAAFYIELGVRILQIKKRHNLKRSGIVIRYYHMD